MCLVNLVFHKFVYVINTYFLKLHSMATRWQSFSSHGKFKKVLWFSFNSKCIQLHINPYAKTYKFFHNILQSTIVIKCFISYISFHVPNNSHKLTRSQVLCWTQVGSKLIKQQNCLELGACSQLSTLKGVEGCAEALGWD